jgi:surfactin synthase thioesterase subunit
MSGSLLVRLGPATKPTIRLLCIPQSGGGTTTFRPLASVLPGDIDLLALRPPGRESRLREPPIRDMNELLGALLTALDGYQDLPLALFGYCSGAYLMVELARELIRAGHPRLRRMFACSACGPAQVDRTQSVHAMPDAEFKDYIRTCGIMPAPILDDPTLFSMFEPAIRADFETWEKTPFAPGQPMAVPITVIGGRLDPVVGFSDLLGWRDHTSREFTLRVLPGGHGFLTTDVGVLGAAITSDLRECEDR